MFDFRFFLFYWYTCLQSILDCQFVFDRLDRLVVFRCAFRFFITRKKNGSILLFEKIHQRNCIKFCVKTEIKCANTFEMLTVASGESTMSRKQVQL